VLKLQGKTEEAPAAYLRAYALDQSTPHPLEELGGLGWSETLITELLGFVADGLPVIAPRVAGNNQSQPKAGNGDQETHQDWSRGFDAEWYLEHYPDVASAGMDPLEHFLRYGFKEGRRPAAEKRIRQRISTSVTAG
jgi:hypothetical protein